jgi:hypothetical protein
MRRHSILWLILLSAGLVTVWGCGLDSAAAPKSSLKSKCVDCHQRITPGLDAILSAKMLRGSLKEWTV